MWIINLYIQNIKIYFKDFSFTYKVIRVKISIVECSDNNWSNTITP